MDVVIENVDNGGLPVQVLVKSEEGPVHVTLVSRVPFVDLPTESMFSAADLLHTSRPPHRNGDRE